MIGNKVIVAIPARSGSMGIKDKNIQKVHDRELLLRTFVHANYLRMRFNTKLVVTSDSEDFLKLIIRLLNLELEDFTKSENLYFREDVFLHLRPPTLATSETLISETLFFLRESFVKLGLNFDIWVLMQPTTPFRSKLSLDEIGRLAVRVENDKNYSLVSLTDVEDMHPARMYTVSNQKASSLNGFQDSYYKRRQDLSKVYIRDGAFYLIGDNLIRDQIQYSKNPDYVIQSYPWTINIDKWQDLELAKQLSRDLVKDDPNYERL